jgi:hypothetical protein
MLGAVTDRCRAWRPEVSGIVEVLHAEYLHHSYPMHSHDAWTILLLDAGAVSYQMDRRDRATTAGAVTVTVLPPYVAHSGRSAHPDSGFRKRVLHISTELIDTDLIGAAVDRPEVVVPEVRRKLDRLHRELQSGDEMAAESLHQTRGAIQGVLRAQSTHATTDQFSSVVDNSSTDRVGGLLVSPPGVVVRPRGGLSKSDSPH